MYESLKIYRYKLLDNAEKENNIKNDFNMIDNYINGVSTYILNNIKLTDYTEPIEKAL